MNKEEFVELVKQYSYETSFMSYVDRTNQHYQKLVQAGPEAIPWALERLKDSMGRDTGDKMDHDNSPWVLLDILSILTNGECPGEIPQQFYGMLVEIRNYYLAWGEAQGLIKLS
jgi:hypothetical protein